MSKSGQLKRKMAMDAATKDVYSNLPLNLNRFDDIKTQEYYERNYFHILSTKTWYDMIEGDIASSLGYNIIDGKFIKKEMTDA